jgi:hypothetical protein
MLTLTANADEDIGLLWLGILLRFVLMPAAGAASCISGLPPVYKRCFHEVNI